MRDRRKPQPIPVKIVKPDPWWHRPAAIAIVVTVLILLSSTPGRIILAVSAIVLIVLSAELRRPPNGKD